MNAKQIHLQKWLTQPLLGTQAGYCRLELINLDQLALLADLTENELQAVALDQFTLSPQQLTRLITVLKALGYETSQ